MRQLIALAALSTAGCVTVPRPNAADAAAPPFPVARFFSGRLDGEGRLKVIFQGERPLRVRSFGLTEVDGSVSLTQRVEEQGRPPRTREWRLRATSPGRYSGTLTEATGPVRGEVRGNRLLIAYRMRGGLDVRQRLTLLPGGRSAQNVLVVTKFGIPVAALEELIVKRDD